MPFDSDAQAMAAVIGGQGMVYVGNAADLAEKPDLKMIAIVAEKRFVQFPNIPTLKELGIQGTEVESIWREFTLKKATRLAS